MKRRHQLKAVCPPFCVVSHRVLRQMKALKRRLEGGHCGAEEV